MKQCVAFITYKIDATIIKHFNQLKEDLKDNDYIELWLAYNCSYDKCTIEHDKIFNYNKEIIENDGFKLHYYYWKNYGDFYGHNNDLVIIDFFNNHQDFDRYWFIDYDVLFTGNWNELINYFNDFDYDLLCSNLLTNFSIDRCFYVSPIGINYDINNQLHGFTNVLMLSNTALMCLLNAYKNGSFGFLETFFPTVLHYNKFNNQRFKLGSFNEHMFVDGDSQVGVSTMNCNEWNSNDIKNFKRNKLYHPIKNEF